ncbi:molybdate ABC transporter substrate-binding protein [Robertkochia flava]|uniref:molybdate ABC transporter substrate-binding protein n=1 Tax=Robertkochia flava TaxID=3447986 RepID=UPI001CC8F1C8|nr:molybdate ABC transporter substrate-binding protein [Robertkochia marina]
MAIINKTQRILLAMLFCIILFSGCRLPEPEKKMRIAVASNMQFAMEELTEAFFNTAGIDCEMITGASGQLTAQIREGAPFNLLVSADMKYPMEVEKQGLAASTPQVYAYGKIVIWTMDKELDPSFENLTNEKVEHIAIANPQLAPYGIAAVQALRSSGVYNKVKGKLVFGESIAQTNQFIATQTADAGITAKSVVVSPALRDKGKWKDIDSRTYDAIEQGVVIIKNPKGDYSKEILFCKFLNSEPAQKILRRYGYSVDE